MIGTKLAHYEITSHLGSGGMGDVYQATDSKLGRNVAIKLLPTAFASDPERLSRFRREAQVLASLNHSNIAHVYGLEESGDTRCIVMELVEGETLQARLKGGPVPVDEALKIARQIAEALDAAHEKGVVHRDLKPGNVMLTSEGKVKVLDFGLAKAMSGANASATARSDQGMDTNPSSPSVSNSPTMVSMAATNAGVILGTAAYMSPEQARGKAVDKRADIWAFGVVLYEMVTGKQLFQGEDLTETLASVVKERPDLLDVPPQVRRLLKRCLEKDPGKRLRDIGDIGELLAEEAPAVPGGPEAPRGWKPVLAWAAAAMFAIAAAVALWAPWRSTQAVDRPLVRLDVDLGADVSLIPVTSTASIPGSSVAISPDGMRLVYASGNPAKLFTRRLDQPKASELPGTQGAAGPFFSPDWQWIGFQAGGRLNKISVEGGAVVPLGEAGIGGASWGEDGNILIGGVKGMFRIPASGAAPETVAEMVNGDNVLSFPQVLPGGKAVLFSAYATPSPDAASIEVMTLADRHRKIVAKGGTSPRYLATSNGAGHLVYISKATLFAVPFDLEKLETRGTAFPILDDVAFQGTLGTAQVSFSRTGTMVYRRSGEDTGSFTVAWLDSTGKTQPLLAKAGNYGRPSLSPDGHRLALEVTDGSGTDIWVYDWHRDTTTRLTFTGSNLGPLWSPDGRYIVFGTVGAGMSVARSDGAGKAQPLIQSKKVEYPWSFTADGKRMAFLDQGSKTEYDLWTVPIESDDAGLRAAKPEVFLQTAADERAPALSPDGRWLAYSSDESGTFQIYVRAFPDKGGKWQISSSGGTYPMWPRNGHELFFESLDGRVMAAAYTVKGDSFVAEKVRVWSDQQLSGSVNNSRNMDLVSDGKRIVALMPAEVKGAQQAQTRVIFLMNFFDELRRRVPLGK